MSNFPEETEKVIEPPFSGDDVFALQNTDALNGAINNIEPSPPSEGEWATKGAEWAALHVFEKIREKFDDYRRFFPTIEAVTNFCASLTAKVLIFYSPKLAIRDEYDIQSPRASNFTTLYSMLIADAMNQLARISEDIALKFSSHDELLEYVPAFRTYLLQHYDVLYDTVSSNTDCRAIIEQLRQRMKERTSSENPAPTAGEEITNEDWIALANYGIDIDLPDTVLNAAYRPTLSEEDKIITSAIIEFARSKGLKPHKIDAELRKTGVYFLLEEIQKTKTVWYSVFRLWELARSPERYFVTYELANRKAIGLTGLLGILRHQQKRTVNAERRSGAKPLPPPLAAALSAPAGERIGTENEPAVYAAQ